jgi:hypothetical protein
MFHFSHLCSLVDEVTFAWSYEDTLASMFYQPTAVFKKISFTNLLDKDHHCLCTSAKRLLGFCDPLTLSETSSFADASPHVRTMDLDII